MNKYIYVFYWSHWGPQWKCTLIVKQPLYKSSTGGLCISNGIEQGFSIILASHKGPKRIQTHAQGPNNLCFCHRYTWEVPHPAPCNGVISHGLKLRVFGILPTTHTNTSAKQMCPQSSRSVQIFMCVYLHAQTAIDAGDIRTHEHWLFWLREKSKDPQFEPHAGIKMAQVLGSPLYICGFCVFWPRDK